MKSAILLPALLTGISFAAIRALAFAAAVLLAASASGATEPPATPPQTLTTSAAPAAPAAPAATPVSPAPAPTTYHDVFISGQEGYASYRIPAVIVTPPGTVLAFAEARLRPTDQAENDIVLKRSTDGGATWSPLKLLHEDGANSLNNPTVVQDQNTRRLFLFYQRIPAHLKEHSKNTATGLEGPDIYRNFLLTSDDDGQTWAAPRDLTATTKRPDRATTLASGPGIGIQLTRGPHKNRLLIPFNQGPYGQWENYTIFSDDAGLTWNLGENVPGALIPDGKGGLRSQINEVQIAELPDGSVLLDSRQFAGPKTRRTSRSQDGGRTWSPVAENPALPDPSCMASTFRYSFPTADTPGILLHSGPDSTKRERGTLFLSTDDGQTWPRQQIIHPGPFAYSILTKLPDGTIGCLFEADNYQRLVFARIPLPPAKP
ncbi:MAG: nedA 1 [Verrucomicrobiales bacterium]|nr:nedA 1 [Verrucomicrobiales bacterium]